MRIRALLLLVPLVFASGCTYFRDRGRDACDVFTATLGYGIGAKARVGPINVGVIGGRDWAGLRGGACGMDPGEGRSAFDINLFLVGVEGMTEHPDALARGKGYQAQNIIFGIADPVGPEDRRPVLSPYYTQVEVVLAAGGALRLGVNPGELVDLLVGLVGLDLYNDDGVELAADRERQQQKVKGTKPDSFSKPFGDDPFGL